ncbi:MAG: molybdate ABC transporter substrate-binding protein [Epsilonproteobacteria bacterium]|nr:molybdate ABC transporter substrate-binding protein [Campylobacterota bacterium]
MKKVLSVLILYCGFVFASTIKIAVAANVSYAMPKLIEAFHKTNPSIDVQVLLGSSGKLTAQIREGAPFELFMSANMKYPKALYEEGFTLTKPVVYAKGSLALLSSKKWDFSKGLELLKSSAVKKIAIANPKTAPYGKAALEAMQKAGIYKDIKDKLIYGQSVSQAVVYSIIAADIGLVAKSALYSKKMRKYKKGQNWIEVEPSLYDPIDQGVVLIKNSSKEAKVFYDFILSKRAKKIFEDFGYSER